MSNEMNGEVYLTPAPVVAPLGVTMLPLNQAIKILNFDQLDLTLQVLGITGTSPTADVEIWTGMQTNTLDGWYKVGNWAQQTATATALPLHVGQGLQKFIIWRISVGGTQTPTCTFYIAGVARHN